LKSGYNFYTTIFQYGNLFSRHQGTKTQEYNDEISSLLLCALVAFFIQLSLKNQKWKSY